MNSTDRYYEGKNAPVNSKNFIKKKIYTIIKMLLTLITSLRIPLEMKKSKSFFITKMGMVSNGYFLKNCFIVVQVNNLIGNP